MTLESEINHLKAAIEEVRGGGSGTFDLYSWLALNRDHLLLMVAELLLVLLICCLTLSRRAAYPAAPSSPVAISHAEHLLLNAQLLNTGANVKVSEFELERSFFSFYFFTQKSLHRSKSLSDLPDEEQQQQQLQPQPPSPSPPSDRSCSSRAEAEVELVKTAESSPSKQSTEVNSSCDTPNCTLKVADDSVSVSSNKENCPGVCLSPNGPLLMNGGGGGGTPTPLLVGNGIQRLFAEKGNILSESKAGGGGGTRR